MTACLKFSTYSWSPLFFQYNAIYIVLIFITETWALSRNLFGWLISSDTSIKAQGRPPTVFVSLVCFNGYASCLLVLDGQIECWNHKQRFGKFLSLRKIGRCMFYLDLLTKFYFFDYSLNKIHLVILTYISVINCCIILNVLLNLQLKWITQQSGITLI